MGYFAHTRIIFRELITRLPPKQRRNAKWKSIMHDRRAGGGRFRLGHVQHSGVEQTMSRIREISSEPAVSSATCNERRGAPRFTRDMTTHSSTPAADSRPSPFDERRNGARIRGSRRSRGRRDPRRRRQQEGEAGEEPSRERVRRERRRGPQASARRGGGGGGGRGEGAGGRGGRGEFTSRKRNRSCPSSPSHQGLR